MSALIFNMFVFFQVHLSSLSPYSWPSIVDSSGVFIMLSFACLPRVYYVDRVQKTTDIYINGRAIPHNQTPNSTDTYNAHARSCCRKSDTDNMLTSFRRTHIYIHHSYLYIYINTHILSVNNIYNIYIRHTYIYTYCLPTIHIKYIYL
jgi:hypothetical protein